MPKSLGKSFRDCIRKWFSYFIAIEQMFFIRYREK